MNKFIIIGIVIVVLVIIYYYTRPQVGCLGGPGSTCNLNSDCNAPHGTCFKNAEGVCGCVCKDGWSGLKCETNGIPVDSKHCMGPNTQWKARTGPGGLCECPLGNWVSGDDPTYGYVQCLKCAGGWGPLAGNTPCQQQWKTVSSASTQNCYGPKYTSDACGSEYAEYKNQQGPNGEQSSVATVGNCAGTESCHCINPTSGATQRECKITSWINPGTTFENCSTTERPCSGYKCIMNGS
jgi:hypothetical protein